jgi:hypothetical protein
LAIIPNNFKALMRMIELKIPYLNTISMRIDKKKKRKIETFKEFGHISLILVLMMMSQFYLIKSQKLLRK